MKKASIEKILDYMERHQMYGEWYSGIAEIGYDDREAISGNWNNGSKEKLGDFLEEAMDIEVLWCDEWTNCGECGKAVRTSPDSYGWEASFVWISDCEIACHECVKEYPDDLIETYKNDSSRAIPSWTYAIIEKEGFVCYSPDEYCQRFETGWHPGQNDDPREVATDIELNLPGFDYIFKLDSVGQFDVQWSVFIRKSD